MAAKKTSPLKIIPLGGLDGIGKNMTVFECGDDMVLVDAGLMFPDDSQPGIDLVLPDYTYVLENEEKLRASSSPTATRTTPVRFRTCFRTSTTRCPSSRAS